ncbi:histidine kinase-like ATPase [Scheffersomyces amazonensis]|uniref:histidine kinase-like ATPase n=1 Tax=Scheffersomyces amazonensis TaxID=1078765 RepID=UPI00315DF110
MSEKNGENYENKIVKLDESVINKIAAGEIIIQPANALKEMLENSIDAKSTMIEILVKDGGMKLLQITDNGHGINKVDLGLLCERFATSKISKFEDLENIATYGFRGEALASISHISRLSVVTKTSESPLAYKAYYVNGKMCNANFKESGDSSIEPKPIAGKDGTQIVVEDLFYNIPSRLKALKSKSDEFGKILDVIGRYAIHTGHVGFSCKKYGESLQVLSTRPGVPIRERIRTVYGTSIASELLDIELDGSLAYNKDKHNGNENENENESICHTLGLIKVSGVITNANYNNKKRVQPIFFINHRLVSCDPLKRAINSVYQFFLPKGNYPFMYLSLEIDPKNLDVNIHPTKREVRFLNEDEIIELIVDKVHSILSSVDTSRKFKTQSILSKRTSEEENVSPIVKKYRQENKLVRVDSQQSKISSFLVQDISLQPKSNKSKLPVIEDNSEQKDREEVDVEVDDEIEVEEVEDSEVTNRRRTTVNLKSIQDIKADLNQLVDKPLSNVFNNAVYVGIVDEAKRLCCFQYDVKLFLCDYSSLLTEFYFQLALTEFCNYGDIRLSEPILLEDILAPLYTGDATMSTSLTSISEIISTVYNMSDMFEEYFRLIIKNNDQGKPMLISLPMIHQDIQVCMTKLPYFIYRLGKRVDYSDEKECLQGIMRQISLLYIPEPITSGDNEARGQLDHLLEHTVFPDIRKRFLAPKTLGRDVVQIADLPGLYRVFERC